MFSLVYACINGWVNIRKASDLKRNRAHYDVTVMRTQQIEALISWGDEIYMDNEGAFIIPPYSPVTLRWGQVGHNIVGQTSKCWYSLHYDFFLDGKFDRNYGALPREI